MSKMKIDGLGFQILNPAEGPSIFDRDEVNPRDDHGEGDELNRLSSLDATHSKSNHSLLNESDPKDRNHDPLLEFLQKRKVNRLMIENRYSRKAVALAAYQKQLDLELYSPTKDHFLVPKAA